MHFAQEVSEADDEGERRAHEQDADEAAEARTEHRSTKSVVTTRQSSSAAMVQDVMATLVK